MATFPSSDAASGIWTLKKQKRAKQGDNWALMPYDIAYLVIAGGGGGGAYNGGGGGAGGYRCSYASETSGGAPPTRGKAASSADRISFDHRPPADDGGCRPSSCLPS